MEALIRAYPAQGDTPDSWMPLAVIGAAFILGVLFLTLGNAIPILTPYLLTSFLLAVFLFGPVGAAIGKTKGEVGLGFLLGLLFGPFGWAWEWVSQGNRLHCPFCRELMASDASVCPHCQRDIPPIGVT
jgi:hypothetical protein